MSRSSAYHEWREAAIAHDDTSGQRRWREVDQTSLYDYSQIRLRLDRLRSLRARHDYHGLLFSLNEGIHGNMGGMGRSALYHRAKFGTKKLIEQYIDEIDDSLRFLAELDDDAIDVQEKLDFFYRANVCFGRSALMLSGGGVLGFYHLGVVKTLLDQGLLPRVISGSSAGSLVAGVVGTHTEQELEHFYEPANVHFEAEREANAFSRMFFGKNPQIDMGDLERLIARMIPDMTFQEAYEKTGRQVSITVAPAETHQRSRLLNAITSPNVLIRSAVMASCAIPGIFPPITLSAKNKDGEIQPYLPSRKWIDGSMSNDLPEKRLTRLYQVNHFIVSLTNPLALPFVMDPSQQNGRLGPIKKFGLNFMKETTQFNYSIAQRFFKYAPTSVALAANNINSIVQQNYLGDINILADFSVFNARKVLSALSFEELSELIRRGEKATWPKIEAIRVTTKIGRVLDDILEAYERKEMTLATSVLKKKAS